MQLVGWHVHVQLTFVMQPAKNTSTASQHSLQNACTVHHSPQACQGHCSVKGRCEEQLGSVQGSQKAWSELALALQGKLVTSWVSHLPFCRRSRWAGAALTNQYITYPGQE